MSWVLMFQSGKEDLRAHIIQSYRQTARKEHARILQRRQIIEERKEELENANVQRVRTHATHCLVDPIIGLRIFMVRNFKLEIWSF